MPPLTGQTALITGASAPHGIGRAIAKRLADNGALVLVSDIEGEMETTEGPQSRSALLDGLAEDIRAKGGQAHALLFDVTDADAIAAIVQQIEDQWGGVDILVNNAGSLAGSAAFMATTPEQWQASFAVNLMGPMMLIQAVLPQMKASGGGRIVNIGSTGSLGAEPGFGAYTTMKHGLVGLSKTIAAEFGPDGILCNTVCPGYIATDMHMAANRRLAEERGMSVSEMKQARYAAVPLRDAGKPEDVAAAVAFLAGPGGRYVTGMNLPVTGGVPFGI